MRVWCVLGACLVAWGCSRPDGQQTVQLAARSSEPAAAEPQPQAQTQSPSRPATWAEKLQASPHLPNLHRVTPTLYRGAQPADEGFSELKKMGVKTVVNLRDLHSDRSEAEQCGLGYVHVDEQAWNSEEEELLAVLRVMIDPERQPVFVHCQHGADRTGTSIAAYRVVVQGWSKQEAIREMTEGGFGFHSVWTNLIKSLEKLDVDRIRSQLGVQVTSR